MQEAYSLYFFKFEIYKQFYYPFLENVTISRIK